MAVVGGGGAVLAKEGAPGFQGPQIAGEVAGVFAGQAAEFDDVAGKAFVLRIDHRVGPEGRDDSAGPAARLDFRVMKQRVQRRFRGRQHLDAEALEQRPGPVVRGLERTLDVPVEAVRRGRTERLVEPENLFEHVVEPDSGRRAPKQVVVVGKPSPNHLGIRLDGEPIARVGRDAQFRQRHALAVQHPVNVVVGRDQQFRRDCRRVRCRRTTRDRYGRGG